jgi:hypothetical protein
MPNIIPSDGPMATLQLQPLDKAKFQIRLLRLAPVTRSASISSQDGRLHHLGRPRVDLAKSRST